MGKKTTMHAAAVFGLLWNKYKRGVAALLAVCTLAGCGAAGSQFKPELNKPEADSAMLYVYRPSTLIGIANPDVPLLHIDGRRLARIRIGGHIAVPLSPGRHKLTTTESLLGSDTGRIRGEANVTVPAGATLYLRYTEAFKSATPIVLPSGAFVESTGKYSFEAVPEPEAVRELANTKLLDRE